LAGFVKGPQGLEGGEITQARSNQRSIARVTERLVPKLGTYTE
jgi:hypothetical protein